MFSCESSIAKCYVRMAAITAVALLILSACGPSGRPINDLKSQAEKDADHAHCVRMAKLDKGGGILFGPAILLAPIMLAQAAENSKKEKVYFDCMRDRGYKIEPVGSSG